MVSSIVMLGTQIKKSRRGLQNIPIKVLFKRYWLILVLNVDFMTLYILKLDL